METYFHELDRDVLILAVDGGLNAETTPQLIDELEHRVQNGTKKIILDCSNLNYVSSFGLAMLLKLHRQLAARGGDVKLAGLRSFVTSVLAMTHLDTLFDIYPDLDRARLAFRPIDTA